MNAFAPQPAKPAPYLPMSRAEMEALGWDQCDVIIVSGDAYIDHPSFGMAVIGRFLEAQGLRVGIIAQPDWQNAEPFKVLGKPRLFWGITAGNMDSMVNRYTSDKRIRSDDAYTPHAAAGKRPDRATLVYAQRCREAFKDVPILLGGIEASLRRVAHYDHWSEKVRRSVLLDAKADILFYGNAERALGEFVSRLKAGEAFKDIRDIRGTVVIADGVPPGYEVLDWSELDDGALPPRPSQAQSCIRLPSFEALCEDPILYAHSSRIIHLEANPGNAKPLIQSHGAREIWVNPPPIPLRTEELDGVFELPYARAPHPVYNDARIPAWDMIRFSVNIMRGCFGGCSFCSITEHEGKVIQSRSEASILRELEQIRDKTKGFTGTISDLGGPTANMWQLNCKDPKIQAVCRRPSCVYPDICKNLNTDHDPLVRLYQKARAVKGVKRISIGSGVRYDIAVRSPAYIKELVTHHVGGYLKIAPEHTEDGPLSKMMKPGMAAYDHFKRLFDEAAKKAGKKLYLIPYFIAAHPGTSDFDMMNLALWLKRNGFKADQVQTFLPSPMSLSTAMFHSGRNPLRPIRRAGGEEVESAKGLRQRRLHKAFLRYHDPENWPLLREALKKMGRADLIGPAPHQLVPASNGYQSKSAPSSAPAQKGKTFATQHSRNYDRPHHPGNPLGGLKGPEREGAKQSGASTPDAKRKGPGVKGAVAHQTSAPKAGLGRNSQNQSKGPHQSKDQSSPRPKRP